MNTDLLLVEINNHVATCCFNRPKKRNSLNAELITTLNEVIKKLERDPNVHLILFTANGSSFCAGADLKEMKNSLTKTKQENKADALQWGNCLQTLKYCQKPTLAIIHGAVYGGGCGIVCCCDMVIAAETTTFCFSEVKLGLIPAMISPYVIQTIGESAAGYYFLSAQPFNAHRALQLGMVHHVVSESELTKAQQNLQQHILQNAPNAVSVCKKLISDANLSPDFLNNAAAQIATLRTSHDTQQRLKKFLTKDGT
jgi:methylglutaconyl-CoA hydratase